MCFGYEGAHDRNYGGHRCLCSILDPSLPGYGSAGRSASQAGPNLARSVPHFRRGIDAPWERGGPGLGTVTVVLLLALGSYHGVYRSQFPLADAIRGEAVQHVVADKPGVYL